MISFSVVIAAIAAVVVFWFFQTSKTRQYKRIPGPTGIPILGNILQLGKQMHVQFNKWSNQYGDIYEVKLGTQRTVIISNPKWIKEIFATDPIFSGRMRIESFEMYPNESMSLGIVSSEGEFWETHRHFLLKQLRTFGFGKSCMEQLVLEEVQEVIERFKKTEGKPINDLKTVFILAVINSLWTILTSKRFNHDDPKLHTLVANLNKVLFDLAERGGMLIFMPWVGHLMPEWSGYNKIRKVIEDNKSFFEEAVNEHKENFQEDNIKDFIDVFLNETNKTTDSSSPFYGERAEHQLVATLGDMFGAGTDTTSTTLSWGILYITKFAGVQDKLQQEIKTVTENSRNVSLNDRPSMPYTTALIDEILRYSSITPGGVQHRATEDKEFKGYLIEKDTWIFPNLHHLHHNPAIWGDPETFRPERFLTEDGKFKKNENLIPFQIGRRQCVGESLARNTIFLFLANIFRSFTISFDPSAPEPSLDPVGLILTPQPFSVVMKERS
ncbi:Methyl farnesoate epoxidase [Orchesella cincta]|uniref:Methyl farnesoate epoxidase n=1 Tax=Orchesella cincta TaxID=48709 RepID=A0A1D2N785_ORCCI|nr:Methyl farnesoate epoxidase [Orchesella cincta]